MKKKEKHIPISSKPKSVRDKRITFVLNEEEFKTIDNYLIKYKIRNRSRWFRQTLLQHILKMLEKDYPTLFGENEMRR